MFDDGSKVGQLFHPAGILLRQLTVLLRQPVQRVREFIFLCTNKKGMHTYQHQFISALLAYAAQRGISPQRLCDGSAIDFTGLQKQNSPLSPEQINSLWKNAAQLTDDPCFGLHFGESMQLAALGLIGQIIATSNTVGEALTHAGRMVHLITDMFGIQTEKEETTLTIAFIADAERSKAYPYTFRHMGDYLLGFVLHELDGLLLKKLIPKLVQLSDNFADTSEYERIFRCPIQANSQRLAIAIDSHYAALPIITANYDMQKILHGHIHTLLKTPSSEPVFGDKIYTYLMANSYLCTQSLEAVAANFNMSSRSLQRRLKEEGITFLEIVEEVRKNLAIHYLKSEHYQIKDIAYTLGYNETSAFLKAFKRWTGKTPTLYRNEHVLK